MCGPVIPNTAWRTDEIGLAAPRQLGSLCSRRGSLHPKCGFAGVGGCPIGEGEPSHRSHRYSCTELSGRHLRHLRVRRPWILFKLRRILRLLRATHLSGLSFQEARGRRTRCVLCVPAIEGSERLEELNHVIAPFLLRRTKTDVQLEIPEKSISDFECPLTDVQRTV